MWQVLSGLFLGWALGSNDASNVFGTAVASRMVRFNTAAVLCSIFVVLGAALEGQQGMQTYRAMSSVSANMAFVACLAAAITVTMMSTWTLPVSTSQAVVGALVMIGVLQDQFQGGPLVKVVACWVGTPIGAGLVTVALYHTVGAVLNMFRPTMFAYDRFLRLGLIVAGSYGAYALGANNVANVTGPFACFEGEVCTQRWFNDPLFLSIVGSLAIAVGVITFSKKVMMTVGKNLVKLDAYTAFICVLAEAITIHAYAMVGVPVSTSQAIVGAVLGVGLLKGVRTINIKVLWRILFGWVGTPAISALIALAGYWIFNFLAR